MKQIYLAKLDTPAKVAENLQYLRSRSRLFAPYIPLGWQIPPLRDKSFTMLLTGSAGGGKSRVAAEKVHAFLLKYPSTGLVLRKAHAHTGKSVVPFLRWSVIGQDPRVEYNKSDSLFTYNNGSELYVGGMKDEDQREAVRSIGKKGGLSIVWMEEATQFVEDDYQELIARMRETGVTWRQIIMTTNPDRPDHWINKRLILGGEASVHYSHAEDNPYNPPVYIEYLHKLSGVLRLRLLEGKWVVAEGAVYGDWDPEKHMCDPFPIPKDWRRFRVIDFGYENPFVCQWWAMDPEGALYRYRELYVTHQIVEDLAKQIKLLSGNEKYESTISDHDAEDRATLERHGISTVAAIKDISPGIQNVAARLVRDSHTNKPRLMLFRGALVEEDQRLKDKKLPLCTEEEFPAYAWPKSDDGKPVKEVPVKINDHGMDCTRYIVHYLDAGAGGFIALAQQELRALAERKAKENTNG